MESTYSNVIQVPQSLSGSKSYIIDEAHFSDQVCNITADDTLTICCPVDFKEGLVIDGDLCNMGHTIGTDSVTVNDGYYICKQS